MEGDGVTRREYERLERKVDALESLIYKIDREGSAATKRLEREHDKLDGTVAWIIRGFIAAIGLAVLVWVIIQGQAGG
jgi:hypothetical protein